MAHAAEKIILTGASDGIGKALAYEFAQRGHSLALLARRQPLLEEVKQECLRLGAPQVLVAPIDVSNEALFDETLVRVDEELGHATIFIANAGVTGRSGFDESVWPNAKHCFQINLLAAVQGLERMKLRMIQRGSGTLCGVTSIAAARGMPTSGPYASSKAALATYLETMRVDLKPYGIHVIDIAPGFIDTEMTKKNKGTMPLLMRPDQAAKVFVDGILARKSFVVAPKPWRWIYPILQMLPRSLFDWVAAKSYRSIRGSK